MFFISKFSNEQSEALKKVILSFYTASEISVTKEMLFKSVYDLSNDLTDGLPRNINRRKSDGRAIIELDNIFNLVDAADENKCLLLFRNLLLVSLIDCLRTGWRNLICALRSAHLGS
jgi:hypothetical protein